MKRYLLNFIYLMVLVGLTPLLLYKAFTEGKYYEPCGGRMSGRTPRRIGKRRASGSTASASAKSTCCGRWSRASAAFIPIGTWPSPTTTKPA